MPVILIVDDSDAVRQSVCAVLQAAGYETREAADGPSALEIAANGGIDLAIVDVWMPGMDGLAVLRELRDSAPNCPVVIISGGGPGRTLERATSLADSYGASQVLFKPFEDYELLGAVKDSIDSLGES